MSLPGRGRRASSGKWPAPGGNTITIIDSGTLLMWRKWGTVLGLSCLLPAVAMAQAPDSESAEQSQSTLIQAWHELPDVERIAWPYSFIRVEQTQKEQREQQEDLLKQFDKLHWRLDSQHYSHLASAVSEWQKTIKARGDYREPGDWSPGWLMANAQQRPPLDRVQAIGYCRTPATVEVWDEAGVQQIPWHAGMHLSDIADERDSLKGGTTDMVAVVWPRGHIDHYGTAAWNKADVELVPGVRIVGALDLKGEVFPWMRDAIAGLLAHIPVGQDCRTVTLNQGGDDED